MFSKEKLEELKRNSELTLELVQEIETLQKEIKSIREEKLHYLNEYKKACDEKRKLDPNLN